MNLSLIIPDYIQLTKIDEKCVILDSRKNYFYAVTVSGAKLLDQIKLHGDKKRAINKISSDYGISFEKVEKDMTSFLDQLIKKGLVIEQ